MKTTGKYIGISHTHFCHVRFANLWPELANEPISDRNITDFVSAEQYTKRTAVNFDSKLIPSTLS